MSAKTVDKTPRKAPEAPSDTAPASTGPANDAAPSPIAEVLTSAGITVPADCVGVAIAPMDSSGQLQCVIQTRAYGAEETLSDGRVVSPIVPGSKSSVLTVDKDGNADLYGRGKTDTVPHFWARTGNPVFPWVARAIQSRQTVLPGT